MDTVSRTSSSPIVTPAAALESHNRGRTTGQGVRRMLVKLLNEVARETPRGGSPTSFQGSIGAWPTISSRSVDCIVCALMHCSWALSASSSKGVEARACAGAGADGAGGGFCRKLPIERVAVARAVEGLFWPVLPVVALGAAGTAPGGAAAPAGCL